eukprot:jgi/Ulvmu1/98/UM001_0101.1
MAKKKRKTAETKENGGSRSDSQSTTSIEGLVAMNQLKQSWPADVRSVFSEEMAQPRRQELWELVVNSAAAVCDKYAWATPDERALRILSHFGPIVEVGAGAGYWAHCMLQQGINVHAYDKFSPVTSAGEVREPWTAVELGGPEVLKKPLHANDTLLLCYPDEFEESGESMAAQCLEALQSDTLIHCGELFGDCPMLDKAPWGRTSAPEFQQHLFSMFRCVLKVPLPSWPHCNDFLTVWRRVRVCTVRLPEDSSAAGTKDDDRAAAGSEEGRAASSSAGASSDDETAGKADGPSADEAAPQLPQKKQKRKAEKVTAAAKDTGGQQQHDGDATDTSGSKTDNAEVEMVCDFRDYGLTTEQPATGWAIAPLQHLL